MSLEDPFFVVKDEVLKSLCKTRSLYSHYRSISEGKILAPPSDPNSDWGATELRNALRSIEWDLEDLEDTVQIVERNPAKFKMDPTELEVRKSFISQTKEEVRIMKESTESGKKQIESSLEAVSLSSPVDHSAYDMPSPHDGLLREQQQRLLHNQDEQLNVMSESVGNIRNMSHAIGGELDEQAAMLDEFGTEIENAESKLDATMRKMAKVLHMSNDRRQWTAIGVLSSATLIVLVLLFAL